MEQIIFMGALCSIFLFVIFLLKGLTEEYSYRTSYFVYAGIYALVAVVLANLLP